MFGFIVHPLLNVVFNCANILDLYLFCFRRNENVEGFVQNPNRSLLPAPYRVVVASQTEIVFALLQNIPPINKPINWITYYLNWIY